MSGGTRSYEMARRLVSRGHEVTIVTSERTETAVGFRSRTTVEAGINVVWLPVRYHNTLSKFARLLAFAKFVLLSMWHVRKIDCDLVYATSTPLTIIFPAVAASRINKKPPIVFEVRDLWPELPIAMGALKSRITIGLAQWLERWAYKNSAAVVALSPMMKEGVLKTGFDASCVAVIPNSSDVAPFRSPENEQASQQFRKNRPWLQNNPLIVYAGTLGAMNEVVQLVDLAAALRSVNPDIKLLVVGDGLQKQHIENRANELGVLNENFFMQSRLPKADMPAAFRAATLVCNCAKDLPEFRANSSNKFFDGLAAAKPILINYGGWQRELLISSEAGIVIWQKTPEEAAEMINAVVQDPERLAQMSKNSAALADRCFSRDMLADQLIQVLESVHDGEGTRASTISPGNFR